MPPMARGGVTNITNLIIPVAGNLVWCINFYATRSKRDFVDQSLAHLPQSCLGDAVAFPEAVVTLFQKISVTIHGSSS